MRSLIPWMSREDTAKELEEWHRNIDDLFGRFMSHSPFAGTAFAGKGNPAIESFRSDGNIIVRADLPGVDPKEVDISIEGDVLTVKGERKSKEEKKEGAFGREEIAYGSFERSLRLPRGVDAEKIQAKYDKGVLEITIPAPKEQASKKITVEAKS